MESLIEQSMEQQVTEAQLLQQEKDAESFASLFSSRHRTPKAKRRSSRKAPEFVLRTQFVKE